MAEVIALPANQSDGMWGGNGLIGGLLLGSLMRGGGFGGMGGFGGGYGGGTAAGAAIGAEVVINPTLTAMQNQLTGLSGQINNQAITSELESIESQMQASTLATQKGISDNANLYLQQFANLSTAQAQANFTTLNSINGLGRDVTAANTQTLINNLQNFNQLTGTVVNSTNQIISQGTAMAAQAADCCCKIQNAIHADGEMTRALITANTIQDLRDRNVELAGQVSNNNQNQYLLSTILAHFTPTAPSTVATRVL